MATEAEEYGDCPLCFSPMTAADVKLPLLCPYSSCTFNMCADCIRGMQKAESDEYEIASDGSRQVKFKVAFPSSRAKYMAPSTIQEVGGEEKKSDMKVPADQFIVGFVLLLREAYDAKKLLAMEDSELSSSNLKKKYQFLQETTLDDLRDAAVNYKEYLKKIDKDDETYAAHQFDWEEEFKLLPRSFDGSSLSAVERRQQKLHARPWRDPTLFMGLEELMTRQEQEFVTQLMCNNDTHSLAQAAHIMHGVLSAMGADRSSARAVQDLSAFGTAPPAQQSRQFTPPPPLNPKDMQRIRTRFPLPTHMPRCVLIPVYNINDSKRYHPLKFERKKNPGDKKALALTEIRGVAGRSGLRRGDVVTHIDAEPMTTLDDFDHAVQSAWLDNPEGDLMIVVNAHVDNALALRERAQKMQQAKVQF